MQTYVYKSLRRDGTYVYLAGRDDFTRLPAALREQLSELRFVLELALTPGRTLAREDAAVVRGNLVARGFHLQLPPAATADLLTAERGTDADA